MGRSLILETTFLIDLERDELLAIEGLTEADVDRLLSIIDELTTVLPTAASGRHRGRCDIRYSIATAR